MIVKEQKETIETELGSIRGIIKQIDLKQDQDFFVLYPFENEGSINVIFSHELRNIVIEALDKPVEVFGSLKTRPGQDQPYAVEVQEIEVLPAEEDLPKLSDLKGIAPDALGDKSVEEFVAQIRNDWH